MQMVNCWRCRVPTRPDCMPHGSFVFTIALVPCSLQHGTYYRAEWPRALRSTGQLFIFLSTMRPGPLYQHGCLLASGLDTAVAFYGHTRLLREKIMSLSAIRPRRGGGILEHLVGRCQLWPSHWVYQYRRLLAMRNVYCRSTWSFGFAPHCCFSRWRGTSAALSSTVSRVDSTMKACQSRNLPIIILYGCPGCSLSCLTGLL